MKEMMPGQEISEGLPACPTSAIRSHSEKIAVNEEGGSHQTPSLMAP